jgi:protein-S-isoprenylcysteine O-methyltransferase Ste14
MRRAVGRRDREATAMVLAAVVVLVLLLPFGGDVGARMADAATWLLASPIGAVLRGVLIGVAILAAVVAARTLLGVGASDD